MKTYAIETSDTAEESLERIYNSIAQHPDGFDSAEKMLHKITEKIRSLSVFPEVNQAFGENRISLVGNYSIVYRISEDIVEILRVVPSSSRYIAILRGEG